MCTRVAGDEHMRQSLPSFLVLLLIVPVLMMMRMDDDRDVANTLLPPARGYLTTHACTYMSRPRAVAAR